MNLLDMYSFPDFGGAGEARDPVEVTHQQLPSIIRLDHSPVIAARLLCMRKSGKCAHATTSKYNLRGNWHIATG